MNEVHLDALLRRFSVDGDPDAAGALFDATAPGLFRLALALTPDAATAEDVLQSTFLVVLESAPRYDPARPAWPWLVGILKVKAMEARRRSGRTPDPARVRPPGAPGNPLADAASAEETEEVRRALEELEEPYRSVALLRWRYGLEPSEIAHVRGQAPGTVSSLLSRALGKLRRRLTALPAVFLGTRVPRGLDSIRDEVVRNASTARAGTAAATGGVLVANKGLAAAAVILAVGGLAWWAKPWVSPLPQPQWVAAVHDPAVELMGPSSAAPARAPTGEPLPPPVDLAACDRDLDLFGVVVDGTGTFVAGARVETFVEPWRWLVFPRHPRHEKSVAVASTRSASDGTFTIRLERGQRVGLRAGAPGFAETVLPSCAAGERLTVTLHAGASLEVVLREEDGTTCADRPILLWRSEAPALRREGRSDTEGRCVFPGLTPGRAFLSAGRPTRGSSGGPVIPSSGTVRMEVVLVGGATLSGRVTDARSGTGIPGALVRRDDGVSPPAVCDDGGRWSIPLWPENSGMPLVVSARGYVSAVAGTQMFREDSIDVSLRQAAAIRGRVVTESGANVPGARVGALGTKGEDDTTSAFAGRIERTESSAAVTGADGGFVLEGLDPEIPHTIIVTADGLARTTRVLDAGSDDAGDIVLGKGGRVEGVLLDPEGRPFAGAAVYLDRSAVTGYGSGFAARTDDLGRFRWAGVEPGSGRVRFLGGPFPAVEASFVLEPGKDATDLRLRADKGASITVLVRNSRGTPDEGVLVLGDDPSLRSTTDTEGRARFHGLPPRKVGFTVYREADSTQGKVGPVIPEGQELEVVLEERPPTGVVSGVVVGPTGSPEPRMSVGAFDEAGTRWMGAFCDEEGRFAVDVPLGRAFSLVVDGQRRSTMAEMKEMKRKYGQVLNPSLTSLRGRFEGVTAPSTGIAIRLHVAEKERSLPVRVLDTGGLPVTGLKVLCQGRTLATDAAGRVKFEGMEAVEVEVLVHSDRADALAADTLVPEPVKLVPENREVVLRCRTGTSVEGVVLAPDGTPRPGARLYLATTTGQAGMPLGNPAVADDQGRFRLSGFAGVPQRVWASWFDPAGKTFGGEAAVTPPASGVEIRLAPNPR